MDNKEDFYKLLGKSLVLYQDLIDGIKTQIRFIIAKRNLEEYAFFKEIDIILSNLTDDEVIKSFLAILKRKFQK